MLHARRVRSNRTIERFSRVILDRKMVDKLRVNFSIHGLQWVRTAA